MDIPIGKVSHYFNRISVAVINLTEEIKLGDMICIQGRITDFEKRLGSMEVNHHKVTTASPGMEVAVQVIDTVREGDLVFRVTETEDKR